DKDRVHATGWDARPFPFWPGNQVMWSDGADYPAGPALNGRASNRSLASVVAEICEAAGVAAYDVSDLHGLVRGYAVTDSGTGRAALQPLMLAYGFDAIERDGVLEFRNRRAHADQVLIHDDLARDPDSDEALRLTRAPAAEIAGRVQLAHLDADADYDAVAAELVLPDETGFSITRDELPLALTRAEGRATVARWLQEARQGRETARFGLPPSSAHIGVGDVVSLQTDTYHGSFRIDRIEEVGTRVCEAMRVAEAGAETAEVATDLPALRPYTGPNPVELIFLDLPLLTGDEIPHAPHLAAVGRPWPGSIAVYASPQDSDYALKSTVETAATVGISLTDLPAGPIGIFDRQAGVEVALVDGTLASATKEALLAGANALAIGDPDSGDWEILQFRDATLIGDRHYRLSGLLRGQFGTRTLMPAVRVAGARVVLLNGVPQQIDLPSAARGVARHFRWGPARLALSDPTFRYDVRSFDGNGLRPYPVAHLRTADAGGDLHVNWIRSTRIDGDLWGEGDVPVGEESEVYFVRATQGGITLRDGVVTDPSWTYTAAEMAFDTGGAPFRVEVAQVSERYGTGPFMGVDVG
ncbi:MAG: phage tail protein, partial [Pseudomonadota bacterium]